MTNLESQVLSAAYDLCAPINFEQCGLQDVSESVGIEMNILRGVASSLIKKGLMRINDNGYCYDQKRQCYVVILEDCEWPCDFFTDEEWEEKKQTALQDA